MNLKREAVSKSNKNLYLVYSFHLILILKSFPLWIDTSALHYIELYLKDTSCWLASK